MCRQELISPGGLPFLGRSTASEVRHRAGVVFDRQQAQTLSVSSGSYVDAASVDDDETEWETTPTKGRKKGRKGLPDAPPTPARVPKGVAEPRASSVPKAEAKKPLKVVVRPPAPPPASVAPTLAPAVPTPPTPTSTPTAVPRVPVVSVLPVPGAALPPAMMLIRTNKEYQEMHFCRGNNLVGLDWSFEQFLVGQVCRTGTVAITARRVAITPAMILIQNNTAYQAMQFHWGTNFGESDFRLEHSLMGQVRRTGTVAITARAATTPAMMLIQNSTACPPDGDSGYYHPSGDYHPSYDADPD
ncbi:hypothetical protein PAPYR_8844 [Paratrimastix pyriformis]|uniref:Uncharacterized protein n=1 Tax=Paratrimastix pyriformis TaxID=342808 RepID=A0ABQ8UDC6_9EUKA|nr:hypothetical protein PAPYR_8844 [Paratrimastix pyriformis]